MIVNESQLSHDGFKFLGWLNTWPIKYKKDRKGNETPNGFDQPDYNHCRKAGHRTNKINLNMRGTENIIYCMKCKIYYKFDSSD